MQDNPKLAFTIPDAVQASGLPRTTIYELIGAGLIEARKAGRRTLIPADSLRRYLDALPLATIRTRPNLKAAA